MNDTPSPLFRPEDQPPQAEIDLADMLARHTGEDFGTPLVHQWPSSLRINQHGSRRMVTLTCPECKTVVGCFEDELPFSLDTHHPSCGGPKDRPHPLAVMKVVRYGSGPVDLILG